MLKSIFAAVVLVASVAGLVYAQQGTSKVAKGDRTFVDKAASGNMFEVQLAQYALNNTQSPEVRNFAQRIITDHTTLNQQLTQVAQQHGITVPQNMDKADRKTYDHLTKLRGADFDRSYINQMIKDHEKDIKDFQHEAQHGQNPDLKNLASNAVPILQEHLRMARSIAPQVGATAK